MSNPRSVQCGKPDCRRAWQNERCKKWQRENRDRANSYRPKYTRTCVECGSSFQTGNKHAKYCSVGAGSCEAQGRAKANVEQGRRRKLAAEERRKVRLLESFKDEVPEDADIRNYLEALKNDLCAYCGESLSALKVIATHDHIEHKAGSGADDWTNLTGCCKRCNELKGSLPLLMALPWIPVARDYHAMRKALFAPRNR